MTSKSVRFVALDVEATGIDPVQDRAIELFAIELSQDFQELGVKHWLFNPGIPIPKEATAIHGFTNRSVKGKPPFSQHAIEIQDLLGDACLIAYNGRNYDWRLLHHELRRSGQPGFVANQLVIDPLHQFRIDMPHTLDGATRYYLDQPHAQAHDARADTLAAIAVLKEQLRRKGKSKLSADWGKEHRTRVDVDGLFYADDAGVVHFAFGKFRGVPVHQEPAYLQWITTANFPEDSRRVAMRLLMESPAA